MTERVTTSDLTWAAEWVASFDPGGAGPPEVEAEEIARRDAVVAWINAEIKRREDKSLEWAIVRELARQNNTTAEQIRAHPDFKAIMARAMAAAKAPS
jgi:hypothetical protein